jgi:hypothetical protein
MRNASTRGNERQRWLAARYAAIPNADELAQSFRSRFDGVYICEAGVDY